MSSRYLLSALVLSALFSTAGFTADKQPITSQSDSPCCERGPKPVRFSIRHIEANGVGYDQGYTTLEAFFSPYEPYGFEWTPFIDARGHLFNNGRFAANAGLGMRHISNSRIWGANTYYDYRNTIHKTYNQFSFGLESLGEIWDFRLNGYLPFGSKKSSRYDLAYDHFKKHRLVQSSKREFAMAGVNAEMGAHMNSIKNVPLYFATGPYYLNGKKSAFGGEARVAIDFFDNVKLEASTSYDNIFKWIGQGQLSLVFHLGKQKEVRPTCNQCCSSALTLSERSAQHVDRNEIIPVGHVLDRSIAIDPATNSPFFFVFVDNESSSKGTFESPYPNLTLAHDHSKPRDIIYVFEGDGTTTGMSNGFVMQNNQRLWGSGIKQHLVTNWGKITVPAFTNGYPTITNDSANGIIDLANHCEVSGVQLINHTTSGNLYGISGIDINGAQIHNNRINFSINDDLDLIVGIFLQSNAPNNDRANWNLNSNTISTTMNGGSLSNNLYGIYALTFTANNENSIWNINSNSISFALNGNPISGGISGIIFDSITFNNNKSVWNADSNSISIALGGSTTFGDLNGISADFFALQNDRSIRSIGSNSISLRLDEGSVSSIQGISVISVVTNNDNNSWSIGKNNVSTAFGGVNGHVNFAIINYQVITSSSNNSNNKLNFFSNISSTALENGQVGNDIYGIQSQAFTSRTNNNSWNFDSNQFLLSFGGLNAHAANVFELGSINTGSFCDNSITNIRANRVSIALDNGSCDSLTGIKPYSGSSNDNSLKNIRSNLVTISQLNSGFVTSNMNGIFVEYAAFNHGSTRIGSNSVAIALGGGGGVGSSLYGIQNLTAGQINNNNMLIDSNTVSIKLNGGSVGNNLYGILAHPSAPFNNGKIQLLSNTVSIAMNGGSVSNNLYGIQNFCENNTTNNNSMHITSNNVSITLGEGGSVGSSLYGLHAFSNDTNNDNSLWFIASNAISIGIDGGSVATNLYGIRTEFDPILPINNSTWNIANNTVSSTLGSGTIGGIAHGINIFGSGAIGISTLNLINNFTLPLDILIEKLGAFQFNVISIYNQPDSTGP